MSWSGRTAVVTGVGGFVGSWLARSLLVRGAAVIGLTLPTSRASGLDLQGVRDDVEVVEVDIADLAAVRQAFARADVDSCFHLAAQALVGLANDSPLPTFATNVTGTWNILECCRLGGVASVVVASSDKAYGDQSTLPYTEELVLNGLYPYDASKACTDILARTYAHTYDVPVAVTRMANIYGGGDMNWSRIVPGTIRSILLGEPPVIRSDGTPERDYVYVEDVVDAYLTLAASLPATAGEAFNFGSNTPISALDLVGSILRVAGSSLAPEILGTGKLHGEIDRQCLDSGKAERVLGWRATTALDDGLRAAYEWYGERAGDL